MAHVPRLRTLAVVTALFAAAANAQTPDELAQAYAAAARQASSHFGGLSAERGKAFFESRHGGEWSCSSCHTGNPLGPGRHARTGKAITPLAPAANPERFTSPGEVEKWFKRNCNDVLNRVCTAQEKGDVLAYLLQLGGGRP